MMRDQPGHSANFFLYVAVVLFHADIRIGTGLRHLAAATLLDPFPGSGLRVDGICSSRQKQ